MSRLRFIILCSLAGFAVITLVLFWNARNISGFKLGALKNMLPADVDMRLSNLFLSESGETGRSLAIKAETAHYFKDEDYFLLSEVKADITSIESQYFVTSTDGRYEPNQNLVTLTGSVRTVDSLGRILTSNMLELDMLNGTLTSQGEFCLEDPDMSLSGTSFIYDTRNGLLNVDGRIFMMINDNI